MKVPRIVHVSPYAMDSVSGIARVIGILGAHLSPDAFRLAVCSPAGASRLVGMQVMSIGLQSPFARNLELAVRTFFRLLVTRTDFDLIHCHQVHAQTVAALIAAKVLAKPAVITCHVRIPRRRRLSRGLDGLETWLAIRLAARAVAVSERIRNDFPRNDWVVIPNGVEVARDKPAEADYLGIAIEPRRIEIVFAGRVTRTKGVFTLLAALRRVAESLEDARLITYGPVESPAEYEEAKRSLGVEDRVVDRGFTSAWRQELRGGQVFAIPSQYEGLPMSMLEAMAQGLPVVATPVGGIPDVVVPNRTGLLVPVDDSRRLAEAFEWLGTHVRERIAMGSEARRVVEGKFRADQMAQAYSALYSALLSRT